MCGDRRRRCWAETWDSGDAGVAGVGVGTDFVSLTTLWRAYRRQRYRSWSSADAEGAFCVVCVQFLALCRRWAQQASLLGQVLDCRRRRECTQRCWSASVWQVGAAREVMSPIPTPPLIDHLGVHPNTWGAPFFFLVVLRGFQSHFFFGDILNAKTGWEMPDSRVPLSR